MRGKALKYIRKRFRLSGRDLVLGAIEVLALVNLCLLIYFAVAWLA